MNTRRKNYPLTTEEEILGRISMLGTEQIKTNETVQKIHTEQEVQKEQIRAIRSELKQSITESKEFHVTLLKQLGDLAKRHEEVVALKGRVDNLDGRLKNVEKVLWLIAATSVAALLNGIFDLLRR